MDMIKALLIFMGIAIDKGILDPQMIMMTMIMDLKMINPNFL